MLLPESFSADPPDARLALDPATGAAVGAAAFFPRDGGLHRLRLHVVPTWRRRGVGTLLLEHIAQAGAGPIHASCTEAEPEGQAFLLARAFRLSDRIHLVEGDLCRLRDHVVPVRDRLLARGHVPPGVAIVRPADVPAVCLARLYAEHIVPLPRFNSGYVLPLVRDPRVAESPVLCVAGEVEGMILYEIDPGTRIGSVHGRVINPRLRRGWANTLLIAAAVERGVAAGVRRFRFDVPESNSDTRRLMSRVGAEPLGCTSCFVREAL